MGPRRRRWRRGAVRAALAALGLALLALLGGGDGEELLAAALAAWVEGRGEPGGAPGPGEAWGGALIHGESGNGAGFMNGERGKGAGLAGEGAGFVNGERGKGAGLDLGTANEAGGVNGSRGGADGGGGREGGIWGREGGFGGPRAPPACLGLLSGGSGDLSSLPPRDPRAPALLLAPPPCAPPPPFLLTLVPSAPSHRDRRLAVRDTWGGGGAGGGGSAGTATPLPPLRRRTVFVLGLPAGPEEQRRLLAESRQHGDILQGDFADSYANLTRKTLLLLRWARACCQGAAFLLKADDDAFVDAPAVATYLAAWPAAPPRLYLGRVHWAVPPDRDPRSRHHVPERVFAGSRYPPYCSGAAYVLSRQAAGAVLAAGRAVPLALPEDVWVGLGARGAGVAPRHWARLGGALRVPGGAAGGGAGGGGGGARCCLGAALVSAHRVRPREMRAQWAGLAEGAGRCPWILRGALGRLRCRAMAWGEGLWGQRE